MIKNSSNENIYGINSFRLKIITILISVLIAFLNFFIHRRIVQTIFEVDKELLGLYRMTRSVALILSAIIIYFIIIKIYYLLDKTNQEKNVKSKFWMIYFFINFTILLFVWPGIFKGDEFYMMPVIMRMKIQWTQSLLTTLLYQIALMILPYLFSITLLQIIIISTIASEIYIRIYNFIENKRLANLLFIPFCLLPVLDNNQFTLRTSIISWLFVFLLVDAYIAVKERNNSKTYIIRTAVILAIVMAWKIEYGYLILVFVLFLCVKFLKDRKTAIVGMVSLIGVYFILSLPGKLCQPMSNYLMTSIFTPLSTVLSKNIDDMNSKGILTEELNEIESLTPIYDIINTTSGINLPNMYWDLEDNISNQDQIEWIKAGAKICIHYWKDYLDNRIYVYKYTNGMVPNVINHTGSEDSGIVLNMQYYGKNYFYEHFKYTKPILGSEIRKRIISLLACREFYDYKETNILYGVMYNSFIPLLLLAAILLLGLINKNFCDCIAILIMVCGVAINFILAPAHFWMYYMPFYLAAYVFIFFKLILRLDTTKY